jgi:RNA polymerase sigma factor (sigma-70 family)
VCNPAYLYAEYRSLLVSEGSDLHEYELGQRRLEWVEEEIAAIRVVLQRLTAARVMNSNDAEDLVQDTLLTMIMKHPGSELEKGLLVWSMGILRKKVGNYYRRAQRYAALNPQKICARECVQQSMLTFSPEVKVFHEELQRIIDETLAQLPAPQRQAMELLIAGHDPGEIVKELYPERYQNVINRLYRGRQRLAKELAKHGYGPMAKAGLSKCVRLRQRARQVADSDRRMAK